MTEPATRWKIYLKWQPVAIEPSTYYSNETDAFRHAAKLLSEHPELDQLEIRPVERGGGE